MKRILIATTVSLAFAGAAAAGDMKGTDTNGDGSITKAEYDAGVAAGWARKDKDANGQLTLAEAGATKGADWTAADTNGDDQLSADEYKAKKAAWFAKSDTDRDGAISKAEHDAAMKAKAS